MQRELICVRGSFERRLCLSCCMIKLDAHIDSSLIIQPLFLLGWSEGLDEAQESDEEEP
jgi:hypothetical protein